MLAGQAAVSSLFRRQSTAVDDTISLFLALRLSYQRKEEAIKNREMLKAGFEVLL